ncbi:MAG: hypothetical protein HY552_03915 [Elusimicrobia bacterium]|nr:hypothetical protein [Elusimicrobiota bacterium]
MPAEASPEVVKKVLFTALDALRDYLSDIVIVGGWVPQIYAWKEESPEIAVHSNDVDAAIEARIPLRGEKGIVASLQAADFIVESSDSGFGLTAFGKKSKPSTRFFYRKGKVAVPFEFITPLFGSGEDTSTLIQSGLIVPALRYTDILLAHTETVSLEGETLKGERIRSRFKVPTLPAFVLTKGLIFTRRPIIEKKGKDLAYIYEVLLKPEWRKRVVEGMAETAAKHPAPWYRKFKRNLEEAFTTENSSGPVWTALQYTNRDAAEMRRQSFQTFRAFLAELK